MTDLTVKGAVGGSVIEDGEAVRLEIATEQGTTVALKVPFHCLQGMTNALLMLGHTAENLRAQNPIHKDGVDFAFILRMKEIRIGQTSSPKFRGLHTLAFTVENSQGGRAYYLMNASREEVESLGGGLLEYLDSPDSKEQGHTPAN